MTLPNSPFDESDYVDSQDVAPESEMPAITPARVCRVLEGMYLLDMHEIEKNKFADKVYMWCHIVAGTCKNTHEDWREEFLEAEKSIHEAMKAPSQRSHAIS